MKPPFTFDPQRGQLRNADGDSLASIPTGEPETGHRIAATLAARHGLAIPESAPPGILADVVKRLRKQVERTEQLCTMVNDFSVKLGLGKKKVNAEDWTEEARELLAKLASPAPVDAEDGTPVSPAVLARGESCHVATYHTRTGLVALTVTRHGTANGVSYYSYTGKHGAGSGHSAKYVAETVKFMLQSHRGVHLAEGQLDEMRAAGLSPALV